MFISCANSLKGTKVNTYKLTLINKEGGSANHNWEPFSFKCNYQINYNIMKINGEVIINNKKFKKGVVPEWGHVIFAFVDIDGIIVDIFRKEVSFAGMSYFSKPVPIEAELTLSLNTYFLTLSKLIFHIRTRTYLKIKIRVKGKAHSSEKVEHTCSM